jgi:hypothetical protein
MDGGGGASFKIFTSCLDLMSITFDFHYFYEDRESMMKYNKIMSVLEKQS